MPKTLLHVGCGTRTKANLKGFQGDDWREIRFDIDPSAKPDIIGSITDMGGVPSGIADAVYSSHNIEHVHQHEVQRVLRAFLKVLKPDGFLVVTCPDILSVAEAIVKVGASAPLFESLIGPITPLDILYGHGASIAGGNEYMAHKYGFTLESLTSALQEAGFTEVQGFRGPEAYDLWLLAFKGPQSQAERDVLAARYLP